MGVQPSWPHIKGAQTSLQGHIQLPGKDKCRENAVDAGFQLCQQILGQKPPGCQCWW